MVQLVFSLPTVSTLKTARCKTLLPTWESAQQIKTFFGRAYNPTLPPIQIARRVPALEEPHGVQVAHRVHMAPVNHPLLHGWVYLASHKCVLPSTQFYASSKVIPKHLPLSTPLRHPLRLVLPLVQLRLVQQKVQVMYLPHLLLLVHLQSTQRLHQRVHPHNSPRRRLHIRRHQLRQLLQVEHRLTTRD
jgi:hypothetical protein